MAAAAQVPEPGGAVAAAAAAEPGPGSAGQAAAAGRLLPRRRRGVPPGATPQL